MKEKSKIPITVMFEGGISRWSGLLEIALESGHVTKPSNAWYSRVNLETGEIEEKKWRAKDTDSKEFWLPILTSKSFGEFIKNKYSISNGEILADDAEIMAELDKIDSDEE